MSVESASNLFVVPSNAALLRRFALELEVQRDDSVAPEGLLGNLKQIINLMIANPEKFDEFASVNSEWIGSNFIAEIAQQFSVPEDKRPALLRSIFTSAYRFLCELEFTQSGEASFEVRKVMHFVHNNLEAFQGNDRQQLVYAAYSMPAQVAKG